MCTVHQTPVSGLGCAPVPALPLGPIECKPPPKSPQNLVGLRGGDELDLEWLPSLKGTVPFLLFPPLSVLEGVEGNDGGGRRWAFKVGFETESDVGPSVLPVRKIDIKPGEGDGIHRSCLRSPTRARLAPFLAHFSRSRKAGLAGLIVGWHSSKDKGRGEEHSLHRALSWPFYQPGQPSGAWSFPLE